MVWDCNGVGEDSVDSGIGLGGAGGVAFAKVLGPAAGSVVVNFSDLWVGGRVDFGDDGVGFSVKVLGPEVRLYCFFFHQYCLNNVWCFFDGK